MNKILRYSLMLLVAMFSTLSYAQTTVTFTAGTDKGTQTDAGKAGDKVTKDGITIETTDGNSAFAAAEYRFAKSSTTTFSSTVGKITKVVFTCTANGTAKYGPGCFTDPSTGNYTYKDKEGTWTGDADSFTLKASSNQVRATKIEVTYTPNGGTPTPTVEKPTISGTTPFTDKTTVTITVPTGTTVYYTTNGAEPTDNGDEYTAPFEIKTTTTVKAVAYNAEGTAKSEVVTKEFVKRTNVTTTGQGTVTSPYTVADANAILAAEAETADTVYVTGTISKIGEVSTSFGNATYYISDDGTETNQLEVFRSYYLGNVKYTAQDQIKVGDKVVVKSVLLNYEKDGTVTPELSKGYLYSLNGKTSSTDTPDTPIEGTAAADIAAFKALSKNTVATLTLKNVVVLYSWTSTNNNNSTYIRDASGALLLYSCGLDLKAGDILNGSVVLNRSDYNNTIQGQKTDKTNKDNITVTDGDEPVAKTILYADAKDNVSDLVVIRDVDIVEDNSRFYIGTDADRLQVYNGFYISGYNVAAAFYVNVKGIITRYKDTYEIYPIEDPSTTTGINGVKTVDNDKDAPVYNLAGQRVSKDYKGVVIQNGKKRINK